nr:hypothetical protein [uncultured bacterium]
MNPSDQSENAGSRKVRPSGTLQRQLLLTGPENHQTPLLTRKPAAQYHPNIPK